MSNLATETLTAKTALESCLYQMHDTYLNNNDMKSAESIHSFINHMKLEWKWCGMDAVIINGM